MADFNEESLKTKVKSMYKDVAEKPDGDYHFEMGRELAERLGYEPTELDQIPAESVESFAGVGNPFEVVDITKGARVLDVGSGSGMDVFIASLRANEGSVVGVDMTEEQLEKSRSLAKDGDFDSVDFIYGLAEQLPFEDGEFDVVVSNGVVNLSPHKNMVFSEIARVLKPGGSLAISDIVTEKQLVDDIKANEDLWAACIGGAIQIDDYKKLVEDAGMEITDTRDNNYEFISDSAQGATKEYGVKSVTICARKTE